MEFVYTMGQAIKNMNKCSFDGHNIKELKKHKLLKIFNVLNISTASTFFLHKIARQESKTPFLIP